MTDFLGTCNRTEILENIPYDSSSPSCEISKEDQHSFYTKHRREPQITRSSRLKKLRNIQHKTLNISLLSFHTRSKKLTYKAKTKEVENEGRKKSVEKRTTAKTPHWINIRKEKKPKNSFVLTFDRDAIVSAKLSTVWIFVFRLSTEHFLRYTRSHTRSSKKMERWKKEEKKRSFCDF